jgi:arginase
MCACMDDAIPLRRAVVQVTVLRSMLTCLIRLLLPAPVHLFRGGLTYREAHLGMEKIAEAGGMRSLEIVEINTALER